MTAQKQQNVDNSREIRENIDLSMVDKSVDQFNFYKSNQKITMPQLFLMVTQVIPQ